MVVRLGAGAPTQVVGNRYRILQGQTLQLQYASSVTPTIRAWARVMYDNGEDDILFIPDSVLGNTRVATVLQTSDVARMDGWVTDSLVWMPMAVDSGVRRGQVYTRLYIDPFGPVLSSDYCYATFGQVALGTYIQSGPGGGAGDLHIETLKANGAPIASGVYTLRSTNTIKKVNYFVWYYASSSDVATRVLNMRVTLLGAGLPTGYGVNAPTRYWSAATLTLTADEDGYVWGDTHRSGINDDGTLTIDNQASAPTPFPLWCTDDDLVILGTNVVDEEVLDFEAVYAQIEEWLVIQD